MMTKNQINEKTLIPIGATATIVSLVAGGIFWISAVYAQGRNNAASIEEMKSKSKEDRVEILDIVKETRGDVKELNRKVDHFILRGH